jgi:hypothetical protein
VDYPTACANWKREFAEWEKNGEIRQNHDGTFEDYEYWEYADTPDSETCRPIFTEEPTWWQVYETVSEGTPVSPPFATAEELIDYLVENGDFWDQRRGAHPPSREAVESFVKDGWAPSMIVDSQRGVVAKGINACEPEK